MRYVFFAALFFFWGNPTKGSGQEAPLPLRPRPDAAALPMTLERVTENFDGHILTTLRFNGEFFRLFGEMDRRWNWRIQGRNLAAEHYTGRDLKFEVSVYEQIDFFPEDEISAVAMEGYLGWLSHRWGAHREDRSFEVLSNTVEAGGIPPETAGVWVKRADGQRQRVGRMLSQTLLGYAFQKISYREWELVEEAEWRPHDHTEWWVVAPALRVRVHCASDPRSHQAFTEAVFREISRFRLIVDLGEEPEAG